MKENPNNQVKIKFRQNCQQSMRKCFKKVLNPRMIKWIIKKTKGLSRKLLVHNSKRKDHKLLSLIFQMKVSRNQNRMMNQFLKKMFRFLRLVVPRVNRKAISNRHQVTLKF